MKYNKKIVAGLLAASLCAGSIAFAAPAMTRNIGINYNLKLKVNGQDYTVDDENQRPFKTSDGRAYVSVASLNKMGIATSTYADGTVTIKNMQSGSSDLQSQLNAVIAQNNSLMTTNNKLLTENAKLKAEIETLKGSESSGSTDASGDAFEDLRSSDKRELESDVKSEFRSIRSTFARFISSSRFVANDVSIDDDSITIEFVPYTDWTDKDEYKDISSWNKVLDDDDDYDDLEEDFQDFFEEDIMEILQDVLDDYKGYDIKIEMYSDTDAGNKIIDAEYRASKDKIYVDFYDAK